MGKLAVKVLGSAAMDTYLCTSQNLKERDLKKVKINHNTCDTLGREWILKTLWISHHLVDSISKHCRIVSNLNFTVWPTDHTTYPSQPLTILRRKSSSYSWTKLQHNELFYKKRSQMHFHWWENNFINPKALSAIPLNTNPIHKMKQQTTWSITKRSRTQYD